MRLLAIDPGQTSGFVVLRTVSTSEVRLVSFMQEETKTVGSFLTKLNWLRFTALVDLVIIEDYRIYAGAAKFHIGKQLHEAELIGATKTICHLEELPCAVVPAAWKNRFPVARLTRKFPDWEQVQAPHALDALKLGLVYLEKKNLWKP